MCSLNAFVGLRGVTPHIPGGGASHIPGWGGHHLDHRALRYLHHVLHVMEYPQGDRGETHGIFWHR